MSDHDRLRRLMEARAREEAAGATRPSEDPSDLEDLAALKDGRLTIEDINEGALDRLYDIAGTLTVADFVATEAATEVSTEAKRPRLSVVQLRFRWASHLSSIAAALAVVIIGVHLLSDTPFDTAEQRRFTALTTLFDGEGPRLEDAAWGQPFVPGTTTRPPDATVFQRGADDPDDRERFQAWRAATLLIGDVHLASAFLLQDHPGIAITSYRSVEAACQEAAIRGMVATIRLRRADFDVGGEFRIKDAGEARVLAVDLRRDLAALQVLGVTGGGVELSADDVLSPGDEVFAVGAASGAVPWAIQRGPVARLFGFSDPESLAMTSPRGASAALDRTRVDAIQSRTSPGPGMIGGPLLNAEGAVVGVTVAIATPYGRPFGFHARSSELRDFLAALPQAASPQPIDLWTAGALASEVDRVHRQGYLVPSEGGAANLLLRFSRLDTQEALAWSLYLRSPGTDSDSPAQDPSIPRGLPGMEDFGDFPFDLVFHRQGEVTIIGESDGTIVHELWADRDGDGRSDIRWTRGTSGFEVHAEEDKAMLDRLDPKSRVRLRAAITELRR